MFFDRIPPLLIFIIFCFFFSPPRARIWKKGNNGKNKCLILFASGVSLRKCPFKNPCFCFLMWIYFVGKTCLFDFLGICVQGVGILCCFLFAAFFGHLEKNSLSVQVFSRAWILWIGCLSFSCSSYYCAPACLVCLGSDCFFFTPLSSCCFFYFISWFLIFLCGFRADERGIYIYIYTYTYAVKILSGPSLAIWRAIIWAKVILGLYL